MIVIARIAAAPVGFSPKWWSYKHVRLHHRYVSNPEFDPDIQFGYFARVSRAQTWQRLHTTQHLHMWALLPFATLNMLKPSELWTLPRFRRYKGIGNPPGVSIFLIDKYFPLSLVWVPVLLVQGVAGAVITFFLFQLIAGTLSSIVTQVQHNTALADTSSDYTTHWRLCEQLARTTDVGISKNFWWWLCGGTNFHVVHHLIPSLSFLELPAATERLRCSLARAGIIYPVHERVWDALKSHGILLRELGRPLSD